MSSEDKVVASNLELFQACCANMGINKAFILGVLIRIIGWDTKDDIDKAEENYIDKWGDALTKPESLWAQLKRRKQYFPTIPVCFLTINCNTRDLLILHLMRVPPESFSLPLIVFTGDLPVDNTAPLVATIMPNELFVPVTFTLPISQDLPTGFKSTNLLSPKIGRHTVNITVPSLLPLPPWWVAVFLNADNPDRPKVYHMLLSLANGLPRGNARNLV